MKSSIFSIALALASLLPTAFAPQTALALDISTPNAHLYLAQELVENVSFANNEYGSSPNYMTWAGLLGASEYANRTMCNHFVTRTLQAGYDVDDTYFKSWFGKSSPLAKDYHEFIEAEDRFTRIANVTDILPGDILAIKYPAGSSSSGHMMIATKAAVVRNASAPLQSGTVQYEIEVADSAQSGHGATDTRKTATGDEDGAGIGIFRIYADQNGAITGYTWSTYSNSVYYSQSERHLVVGRIDLAAL
jgi:hypothetical protein